MKNYFKDIIALFTASSQNEEMKRKFHGWLIDDEHSNEKDLALYEYWTNVQGKEDEHTEKALQEVYAKSDLSRVPKYSMRRFKFWGTAAAVALLLVISVYVTFEYTKQKYAEIVTVENYVSPGQTRLIQLPDGTKVHVNSGTLLLYPEKFVGSTRTVFLVGEANFKVKKNSEQPFIVRSGTMSVTALGTEFNVCSYSEDHEVIATLLEGKVRITCGTEGKSYVLSPGEQVVYDKTMGTSRICKAEVDDVTAWQRGELVFRSVTVDEMLAILQRRFDVVFHYSQGKFNEDKYNIRFSDKASLEEVLTIMKAVVGDFTYHIENRDCIIK